MVPLRRRGGPRRLGQMGRQLNPAAVRTFLESRMGAYYGALAENREDEWSSQLDDEIEHLSRGWEAAEVDEFHRVVEREFRAIRLEMQLAGPEAVADRFGVMMPSSGRPPLSVLIA